MESLQGIVGELLLATDSSRVVLQLAHPGAGLRPVAEAVRQGARQLRHDVPPGEIVDAGSLAQLEKQRELISHDDIAGAGSPAARELAQRQGARAQILAPLFDGDRLAGVISIQHAAAARKWQPQDLDAVRRSQGRLAAVLQARRQPYAGGAEALRDAGLQAMLDHLRTGLRVHRCTLRQNVSAAYAFPVTHESRGDGVWSLLGDFTIVQSGQPVIEKMLKDRTQVVQNDCRTASTEPLFHVMLKHYGDMRAQIVTPMFREDSLAAVLSIHSLKELRDWTPEETAFARSAARMLGLLIGATLA